MKTTLELPDELMRAVKMRAVQENRKLKDTVAELLRHGLAQPLVGPDATPHRVTLPLVECAHSALPEEELTPGRVAQILLDEDAANVVVR
jgi:hypothetical protein